MTPPAQSFRIVYAKLTSTGAYDVVARTSNIPLDRARSLAERLLPGNPPLDAAVGEEIGHLRPPDGGHIVMRFTRYDWADGGRGDVYMTDILWVSDAEFAGARSNAFALVPRTTQIFDVLTELPAVTAPERSAAADLERIAELRGSAEAARALAASAMAANPVLLVHDGDRARAMELVTLLLPPRVRAHLTFQTQAFRVPALVPRVTLTDRVYANLRDGPWRILPDVEADVPYPLAAELVALADDTGRLGLIHDLCADAYDDVVDLRTSVLRLTRLVPFADALRSGDAAHALAALAALTGVAEGARSAGLRALRRALPASDVRDGLLRMISSGEAGARHGAALLTELGEDADAAAIAGSIADALPAGASEDLVLELATRAARQGDLPRLILLLARDRRSVPQRLPLDDDRTSPAARNLTLAIRDAAGARHDFRSAARLLGAATAAAPSLTGAQARNALHRMCRDAVTDALERTPATLTAVAGLLELQDAAASYLAVVRPPTPLPALFAPYELEAADLLETLPARVHDYTPNASAVVAATLLRRVLAAKQAGDAEACSRAAAPAAQLIARGGRQLAQQVLHEQSIREAEIADWPGGQALAESIGVNTRQAGLTRRIREAIHTLHAQPERGVPELAAAVLVARGQNIRLVRGTELWDEVMAALRAPANATAPSDTAGMEICIELLSVLADAQDLHELDDAALDGAMAARLRRLDRGIAICRAAEEENRYEEFARALETGSVALEPAARERLRTALGTRSVQRRLMRVVSGVVERDAS
ncbi:hypothetical protein BH23GEM9_BH23GEM9_17500 [soil metagenome]